MKLSLINLRKLIVEEILRESPEKDTGEADTGLEDDPGESGINPLTGKKLENYFCRIKDDKIALRKATIEDIIKYKGMVPSYYSEEIDISSYPPIDPDLMIRVSSEYGDPSRASHKGIDYVANAGTPIYAVADGTVRKIYNDSTNGFGIDIDHGAGEDCINHSSQYIHMLELPWDGVRDEKGRRTSASRWSKGDAIKKGDHIGRVGNSGASRGAHLHFQIKQNGVTVDPTLFTGPDTASVAHTKEED